MKEKGVRFQTVGDLTLLPDDVRTALLDGTELTKDGTVMTAILAVAYSGQDEIIRGIRRCIVERVNPETLTEKDFLHYLDTGVYPPPDVIVRTG